MRVAETTSRPITHIPRVSQRDQFATSVSVGLLRIGRELPSLCSMALRGYVVSFWQVELPKTPQSAPRRDDCSKRIPANTGHA